MSWVEVDGAGWSCVEVDGTGWRWVHGLVTLINQTLLSGYIYFKDKLNREKIKILRVF